MTWLTYSSSRVSVMVHEPLVNSIRYISVRIVSILGFFKSVLRLYFNMRDIYTIIPPLLRVRSFLVGSSKQSSFRLPESISLSKCVLLEQSI